MKRSRSRSITIRRARVLSGYTLETAAFRLGISASALGRYERNPSIIYPSVAVKIADLYNVSIDDLDFSAEPSLHRIV